MNKRCYWYFFAVATVDVELLLTTHCDVFYVNNSITEGEKKRKTLKKTTIKTILKNKTRL